ncbi:hypothetical protein QJS66_13190 [Kocuria rhizophila]|nr:hypothetical protein QJS66_13190 [Kocuria rhizophila]
MRERATLGEGHGGRATGGHRASRPALERAAAPVVIHWHGGAYVHHDGNGEPGCGVEHPHAAHRGHRGDTGYGLAPDHTVDEALALANGVWSLARFPLPAGLPGQGGTPAGGGAGGRYSHAAARGRSRAARQGSSSVSVGRCRSEQSGDRGSRSVDHMLDTEGPRAAGDWSAGTREVTDPWSAPRSVRCTGLRAHRVQGGRDMLFPGHHGVRHGPGPCGRGRPPPSCARAVPTCTPS